MDDGKLVFRGPADGTGKLVFGAVDEGGGIAPVSVQLDADLGGLDGDISVAIVTRAMLDADLGGLEGDIGALWDAGVVEQIVPTLSEIRDALPSGYLLETGGTVEDSARGQNSIKAGMPLFLVVVATLLMVQLRSFSRAAMVFITAPLGIIGAT